MAILLIRIEDPASLRMNEFFDFNGYCWALSRRRAQDGSVGAELEDFYDATIRSSVLSDVPVIFTTDDGIVGWYKTAEVYRYIRHPALFLEGNVRAMVKDVRLLEETITFESMGWHALTYSQDKNYLVVEHLDVLYEQLSGLIEADEKPWIKVGYDQVKPDERMQRPGAVRGLQRTGRVTAEDKVKHYLTLCQLFASEIMEDRCAGIAAVKALYQSAFEATRIMAGSADGWYYLAFACDQLGFSRKGLKAVDKALRLEPDGDDLLVLKGNLLVEIGCFEEALDCYEKAYAITGDDAYQVMAGRACACMGNTVAARQYYKRVRDPQILAAYGVDGDRR